VYFVLLAAAVAILACVVAVAMGWGGEMAASRRDLPARGMRARTAAEVAMLRLPAGAFGYQREATDLALHAIAGLVAERDAEIADLRQELWRLRAQRAAAEAAQSPAAGPAEPPAAGPAELLDAEPEPHEPEPHEPEPEPTASESAGLAAGEVLSGHGQAAGPQPPSR
jgi:uncharacterized small protein (DUF1192 family)